MVKSISPSLAPSHDPSLPHVQAFFCLFPQAQAASAAGTAFSVAAFRHVQCKAGCLPHEQVDFLAQVQSVEEQAIVSVL